MDPQSRQAQQVDHGSPTSWRRAPSAPSTSYRSTGTYLWQTGFITTHSCDVLPRYGSGTGGFYDYLYQLHGQFPNHTLWVTEFAETSSNDSVVLDFLNETITTLDGLDFVERYAWFGYFVRRRFSSQWDTNPYLRSLFFYFSSDRQPVLTTVSLSFG